VGSTAGDARRAGSHAGAVWEGGISTRAQCRVESLEQDVQTHTCALAPTAATRT
jgi:hypothetical protein